MNQHPSPLEELAIGPNIRNYLEIPSDSQPKRQPPNQQQLIEIEKLIYQMIKKKPLANQDQFIDIVEEAVIMGMGRVGLNLVDFYPKFLNKQDYRLVAACAHAFLLECDYKQAEHYYLLASQIEPEEPAPWVNLAQIYVETKQFSEGELSCLKGLKVDANHPRLWELYGFFIQSQNVDPSKKEVSDKIKATAQELDSWVGVSFALDFLFSSEQDGPIKKLEVYNQYYAEGNRDWNFLVEYTGMLGSQGLFEKIVAICKEFQSNDGEETAPWQLQLHKFQALLAMNHLEDAIQLGKILLANPSITQPVEQQLQELIKDTEQEMATNGAPLH